MEQTNQLISTAEAAKFLGIKVSYLHKLCDATRHTLLQAQRQTVLL